MPIHQMTRREALAHAAVLLPMSHVGFVRGNVQEPDRAPVADGWPMTTGPYGNYTPKRCGARLVDDMKDARQVWNSDDTDLGFGKGSVSGYLQNLARRPSHPGSAAGPIVADGKVIASSFRPSGDVWAENTLERRKPKKPFTEEETQKLRRALRIDADDVLLAVDLRTGRTAWKVIEENKGLNRYMGKREGFNVAPAFFDGMVFSMGSTGLVNAYESGKGKKLWQSNIGKAHNAVEQLKRESLKRKTLPGGLGWNVSLVVAEGVLIVPLFDGIDTGLRGVDVKTGRTKWELPKATCRYATPAIYREGSREYLLLGTRSGEVRLIDPQTGRVLWTLRHLAPHYYGLVPDGDLVFLNVGSNTPRKPGDSRRFGRLGGYRISSKGAKPIWSMPDQAKYLFPTWMDSCSRRFLTCRDGLLVFRSSGPDKKMHRNLCLIQATTGKVLAEMEAPGSSLQMYLIEDRMLVLPDAAHSDRLTMCLYSIEPKNFRKLGTEWKPPHPSTTAYEVLMEFPYVDGRVYMRSQAGDIRCYDLRRK